MNKQNWKFPVLCIILYNCLIGSKELAQMPLSGVKISISKLKFFLVHSWSRVPLKYFLTKKRVEGIMNYMSYHFYSI